MKPKLFIGSSYEGRDLSYSVQSNLKHDFEATVWDQGVFQLSSPALESLLKVADKSDFGVFVFTPDDIAKIRDREQRIVRDNVLFELGLFIGSLGRERAFILMPDNSADLRLPTDLLGITAATYETERDDQNFDAATGPACNEIRKAMKRIGLRISQPGSITSPAPIEQNSSHLGSQTSPQCTETYQRSKIALLRWEALTDQEQQLLYEEYLTLAPQHHKPRSRVVDLHIQEELNILNPINVSPLINLFSAFELPTTFIKLPLTPAEYEAIYDLDAEYIRKISSSLNLGLTTAQEQVVAGVYDYLACADQSITHEDRRHCDVALVPGARWSLHERVNEAYRLCAQSNCSIILSGGRPRYAINDAPPVGEADVMYYYLTKIKKLNPAQCSIYIENRAFSTLETAVHILPHLQTLRDAKERPLNLALVTSPYHVRRLLYTMKKTLKDYPHLIGKFLPVIANTTVDFKLLLSTFEKVQERRRFAFGVYVQEFLKLIGGRATGEF